MIKNRIFRKLAATVCACALLVSSAVQPVQACTGIRLIAEDGTVVHARTMEFA
jgi:choloylglycine hydrolase